VVGAGGERCAGPVTDATALATSPSSTRRRWPLGRLRARREPPAALVDDEAEAAARRTARERLGRSFPATAAELAAARRRPLPPPTGVVVLGHGPVRTAEGLLLDDGPLCVPCDEQVTVVAPPVVARAWARAWADQAPWSGGAPRVRRAGSLAEAAGSGGTLVVVESTGTAWARRAGSPGERVPLVPVFPGERDRGAA